jgi:A/G-specific adenine glycosylase
MQRLNTLEFQEKIRDFYKKHGRDLPWRHTTDPYRILVSEVMLQQTRAERVKLRYEPFLIRFPDFRSLARGTIEDVLAAWQGLGYNRRALALRHLAIRVTEDYGGILPDDERTLNDLPGVGPYTAAAVLVFAFNRPAVLIETNVRRVYIHCFFGERTGISDTEIRPLVMDTMDRENPRIWYNALMDYGAFLSELHENPNRRSRHYQRQAPFEGSVRQTRGRVLKLLVAEGKVSETDICTRLCISEPAAEAVLSRLEQEGFVERVDGRVMIQGCGRVNKESHPRR